MISGDREIRSALLQNIRATHGHDATIIEELGLCCGDARVDVLLVSDVLHGFEIKSDRDTLHRLDHQVEIYGSALDRVTLVVGDRHAEAATGIVPAWWGILLASTTPEGITLSQCREGASNPQRDPRALVELLWFADAIAFLARRNAARGVRSKPRREVWDRVCEVYSLDEVAAEVRARLVARRSSGSHPIR